MKICVLQSDYSGSGDDFEKYDLPRNLSPFLPNDTVENLFLKKVSSFNQIREAARKKYDLFINLCDNYSVSIFPSFDVIFALEYLKLPFVGITLTLYKFSKIALKKVAHKVNVLSPAYTVIRYDEEDFPQMENLKYPLFIKPADAGDSLGIDNDSLATSKESAYKKIRSLQKEYDEVLVEEFISGREFTVLVLASLDGRSSKAYRPLEFVFPKKESFKTYELKIIQHHPECNIPVEDVILDRRLRETACAIFDGFSATGYVRMDFRLDNKDDLHCIDINFDCSIFYPEGQFGSADYILNFDGIGQAEFLQQAIQEAFARYQRMVGSWI